MKIFYIGVHSHKGWGAEYWLAKAFKRAGHQLLLYDYRKMREKLRTRSAQKEHLEKKVSHFSPDIIFIQRVDNVSPSLLSNMPSPIVFWSTEPINRNNDVDMMLQSNIYAHVCFHTYSCLSRIEIEFPHLKDRCSVIHNACPQKLIQKKVVSKRPIFALFNRSLSERRKQWIGPSSEYITIINNRFGPAYFKDLTRAKIAVNIHFADASVDDFETGIFEAMARGCAIVSETINPAVIRDLGMEDAIIQVESPDQLRDALMDLQNNPLKIHEYQKRSLHVIMLNTWESRALQFVKKFNEILAAPNPAIRETAL